MHSRIFFSRTTEETLVSSQSTFCIDSVMLIGTPNDPFNLLLLAPIQEFVMKDLSDLHFFLGMVASLDSARFLSYIVQIYL